MRIAIAALGTRGDVAPYVVLGAGLRSAGHEVLMSTMERFRGTVQDAGLTFHALPGDPADVFHAGRIDVSPWRPRHHLKVIHSAVDALVSQSDPEVLTDAWADRDCVIFTGSTTFAHAVAARMGVPSVMVVMTPAVATGAFAHPVLAPQLALGARGNLASWLIGERLAKQAFQEPLKPAARRARRLPASVLGTDRRGAAWPPFALLHAYSPVLAPKPADWPDHVTVTGWLLPAPSPAPLTDRVERFLRDGPPPIYVGFGSMPIPDPDGLAHALVAALRRTGQRAIVGGAALMNAAAFLGGDVALTAEELPHERLFARVAAVVHHGGSGTTGAGLRAGRPTLVAPFVFDQFFWARRVSDLGAGPRPIAFRRLTEDAAHRRAARSHLRALRGRRRADRRAHQRSGQHGLRGSGDRARRAGRGCGLVSGLDGGPFFCPRRVSVARRVSLRGEKRQAGEGEGGQWGGGVTAPGRPPANSHLSGRGRVTWALTVLTTANAHLNPGREMGWKLTVPIRANTHLRGHELSRWEFAGLRRRRNRRVTSTERQRGATGGRPPPSPPACRTAAPGAAGAPRGSSRGERGSWPGRRPSGAGRPARRRRRTAPGSAPRAAGP